MRRSIVPEVLITKLRPPIQAEALPHQSIEVLRQEVGEVERPRFGVVQAGEEAGPGEELVAMSTGQAIYPAAGEHGIEGPTGPAIGVADEHLLVPARRRVQFALDRGSDLIGGVVELGGEPLDVDPCEAVALDHVDQFPRQRPAGDHEHPRCSVSGLDLVQGHGSSPAVKRFASTRAPAVSAATAASRQ